MDNHDEEAVENLRVHAGSACDAASLCLRIFSARWFHRAWCDHEFLVSRSHVFLAGVESRALFAPRILRFTAEFLRSLLEVTMHYTMVPDIEDGRHRLLESQYVDLLQTGLMRSLILHLELNARLRHNENGYQHIGPTDIKSFLDVSLHYSRFGASVEVDKLVITLNILGCDLYLRKSNMGRPECDLYLSVLALAAGDPTVLCSSGENIKLLGQDSQQSWLQRPQPGDFDGTIDRRSVYRRLDYVPEFSLEQVKMDLFFGYDTTLHRASEPFITQATWFVDGQIEIYREELFDIDRRRSLEWMRQRNINIEVWACALECGLECIEKGITLRSFPYPGMLQALRMCFTNDIAKHNFRDLYHQNRDEYELMTQTIESMTGIYLSPQDASHFPAWIQIGPCEMDKLLIMYPDHGSYAVAIPALLLHEDYINCKRIFFLEAVSRTTESWNIRGKTTGFGTDVRVLGQYGMLRQKQRVLG